jgi:hypothetical protein
VFIERRVSARAKSQGPVPGKPLLKAPESGCGSGHTLPSHKYRCYQAELTDPERAAALAHLRELAHRKKMLTLLIAITDIDISEAAVLAKLVLCWRFGRTIEVSV